jgi:hypothetical protein
MEILVRKLGIEDVKHVLHAMFEEMGFRGAAYLPFRAIGLSEEHAVFFATQHRH